MYICMNLSAARCGCCIKGTRPCWQSVKGKLDYVTSGLNLQETQKGTQAVRKMMWTPDSVRTGSLISPTFKEKAASSNGFCMAPRPNGPRSPERLAELQSEYLPASSPNDA